MRIKKFLLFLFLLFFIFIIETVIIYHFNLKYFILDLFLILAIYFAWFEGYLKGSIYGFLIGMFKDIFGFGIFGSNMLIFSILCYVIGRFSNNVDKNSVSHQVFFMGASYYFYLLFFYLIQKISNFNISLSFLYDYLLAPFLIILFTPVLFKIFNNIKTKWFGINVAN